MVDPIQFHMFKVFSLAMNKDFTLVKQFTSSYSSHKSSQLFYFKQVNLKTIQSKA